MISDRQKVLVFFSLLVGFLSYTFYIYSSLPVVNYSFNEEMNSGKMVWQKYNCNACHQIYGLGGYLGPDLTNVYSLRGPDYINSFIKSGTMVMPVFNLTEKEMTSLDAFLKSVDASGKSDPRTFKFQRNGSIQQ